MHVRNHLFEFNLAQYMLQLKNEIFIENEWIDWLVGKLSLASLKTSNFIPNFLAQQ